MFGSKAPRTEAANEYVRNRVAIAGSNLRDAEDEYGVNEVFAENPDLDSSVMIAKSSLLRLKEARKEYRLAVETAKRLGLTTQETT